MASGFPFGDRRQRPRVVDVAAAFSSRACAATHDAPAQPRQVHHDLAHTEAVTAPQGFIDPAGAASHGQPHVDIALVPGEHPHGEVLG